MPSSVSVCRKSPRAAARIKQENAACCIFHKKCELCPCFLYKPPENCARRARFGDGISIGGRSPPILIPPPCGDLTGARGSNRETVRKTLFFEQSQRTLFVCVFGGAKLTAFRAVPSATPRSSRACRAGGRGCRAGRTFRCTACETAGTRFSQGWGRLPPWP